MTEVGRDAGDFVEMAVLLHSVGEERRGARARSGARRASSREVRNKSGTNRREAAIVPPASGTPCRRAKFARFAAQPGHKRWNFLGSSVVVVPSSDKIRQKIIGHSCRDGSRLAQRFRGHDRGPAEPIRRANPQKPATPHNPYHL